MPPPNTGARSGCGSQAVLAKVVIGEGTAVDDQSAAGVQNTGNPGAVGGALTVCFFSSQTSGGVNTAVDNDLAAAIDGNGHAVVRSGIHTLLINGYIVKHDFTAGRFNTTTVNRINFCIGNSNITVS